MKERATMYSRALTVIFKMGALSGYQIAKEAKIEHINKVYAILDNLEKEGLINRIREDRTRETTANLVNYKGLIKLIEDNLPEESQPLTAEEEKALLIAITNAGFQQLFHIDFPFTQSLFANLSICSAAALMAVPSIKRTNSKFEQEFRKSLEPKQQGSSDIVFGFSKFPRSLLEKLKSLENPFKYILSFTEQMTNPKQMEDMVIKYIRESNLLCMRPMCRKRIKA